MTAATWSIVGVTFVLAVTAAWYAWETRRVVDRMDKEREARERPVLALHLVPWGPMSVKLRIQNVGMGPAFNISGAIEGWSGEQLLGLPWSYPLLPPDKYEEFGFPAEADSDAGSRFRMDEVRQRFENIQANFSYKSASGHEYVLHDTIAVRDITEDWLKSRMLATQDHPERLAPRMAKALDDIAQSTREIRRTVIGDASWPTPPEVPKRPTPQRAVRLGIAAAAALAVAGAAVLLVRKGTTQ